MPHIPKSRATSKDVRAAIRYVQESAISVASTAANREKEDARRRVKFFMDLRVKEILLSSITSKINEISKKSRLDTIDMYQVVEELCKDGVMSNIVCDVANKVENFDNNPKNTTKINPTGMNLTKTIERDYMLYMIEFLVRAEVERMKKHKIDIQDIVGILMLDKAKNFEERGKALRMRVRAVVRPLFGAGEKEQRIDKLREETRTIMKSIANDIKLKENEKQYQDHVKHVFSNLDSNTSDR